MRNLLTSSLWYRDALILTGKNKGMRHVMTFEDERPCTPPVNSVNWNQRQHILYKNVPAFMAMSQYGNPGIAAATGTRVDSSSKHTMACRVNEPQMLQWCSNQTDGRNYIHNHKNKFCVHKNELVLNCSQMLNSGATIMHNCKAYPSVVTNLGEISNTTKNVLNSLYYASTNGHEFLEYKTKIRTEFVPSIKSNGPNPLVGTIQGDYEKVVGELKNLPYFTAQGYALGQAWASQLSGDTVSSVLIGGMQTVMNGHFECRAGQMVQWYFDFEEGMFCRKMKNVSEKILRWQV